MAGPAARTTTSPAHKSPANKASEAARKAQKGKGRSKKLLSSTTLCYNIGNPYSYAGYSQPRNGEPIDMDDSDSETESGSDSDGESPLLHYPRCRANPSSRYS